METLKKRKYQILLMIVVMVMAIIGINKLSKIDTRSGKIKIENAYVSRANASISEANIFNNQKLKSNDKIEYEIKYKIDGDESRNVEIKASLTNDESKYASFIKIDNDHITSTLSEDRRQITLYIKDVNPNKENTLKLEVQIKDAPNGFKISPKIEIKEETNKEYQDVLVKSAEVQTISVTGIVRDTTKNGISDIELKIENSEGQEIKRTYTDKDGKYTFSDLKSDVYYINLVEERFTITSNNKVQIDDSKVLDINIKEETPFKIDVKKYISKVTINNKSYTYGQMEKVNQSVKNLKSIEGYIEYKVVVKNLGQKEGTITRVEEEISDGLSFKENNGWKEKNGKIINEELEGISLKAGESKEVKLILQIDKSQEAKNYLAKVTIKGEIYERISYIVDGKVYKEREVLEGEKIEELSMPNKDGIEFSGWYTDKNYTNKYNFNNEVTKDIILYGKYDTKVPKYNVIFIDEGKVIDKNEYEEGSLIIVPANPVKEGYTFSGWYEESSEEKYDLLTPVTKNITLYSKYEINSYKITFKNDDETILQEEMLNYGQTPIYKGSIPIKSGTDEYLYIFSGWNPKITSVTRDEIYTATYTKTKKQYTITFVDEGKSTKQTLDYGSVVVKPQNPIKEGYTFTGWYEEGSIEPYDFPITLTKDITLYSKYEVNKYTIKFFDRDYEIEEFKQEVEYNGQAREPELAPTLEDYKFIGWFIRGTDIPYIFGTPVTENIELESRFTQKDTYLVTFNIDGDIDAISSQTVIEGKKASRPDPDPVKKGYIFDGWYEDTSYSIKYDFDNKVTNNIELYGRYLESSHIVTYINEKETWEEENVLDTYTAQGPKKGNPTKEGYTFAHWSLQENGEKYELNTYPVTEDITLYAVYTINNYLVEFKDDDGSVLQSSYFEYGQMPEYNGSMPAKENTKEFTYEFSGWTPEIQIVTGNQEYIATYTSKKNKYLITFIDHNGAELQSEELPYGELPIYKGDEPSRENTQEFTYEFSGWTPEITEVVDTQVYTAVYNETKNEYTVTFMDNDNIYSEEKVKYGGNATPLQTSPTKEYNIFIGWILEDGNEYDFGLPVENDITLYSKYELVEAPTVIHEPSEWTKDNVIVTIMDENHPEYSFEYKIEGEENYTLYTGPFEIEENCTIIAKSLKENIYSEIVRHEITNIDKINPNIISFDEDGVTPTSIEIIVKAIDNESGLSKIRLYLDDSEVPIITENYSGNEEKELKYTLSNLQESTTYKIKAEAEDAVGNISTIQEKEFNTTARRIVAKIIGRNNELNSKLIEEAIKEAQANLGEDEVLSEEEIQEIKDRYTDEKFESLKDAIDACGDAQCTIQMVNNTEESVEIGNQDVTLDLYGFTITGVKSETIINRGNLIVIDNGTSKGMVLNNNGTAIYNTENSQLTIGEDDGDVSIEYPNIVGANIGIDNRGILYFYDGRIEGKEAAILGDVTKTPYLYNSTVTSTNTNVATLSIISEAEARINSVYYTKLAGETGALSSSKSGHYEDQTTTGNLMSFIKTDKDSLYGFEYDGEKLVSNNQGKPSTTANSYIKIDLSNYTENQILTVNARISSQVESYNGYDYGYATITDNQAIPQDTMAQGRFIYINGVTESTDYTTTLQAGKVYYLHLGYKKNSYENDNDDVFVINGISLNSEGSGQVTEITKVDRVPILNEEPDTIELLRNITLADTLVIDDTKNVVIDLQGKTLTTQSGDYVIKNSGSLTIIDSDMDDQLVKNQKDWEAQDALYEEEWREETRRNNEIYDNALKEYNSLQEKYDTEYNNKLVKKEEAQREYEEKLQEYYLNNPVIEFEYKNEPQEFIAPVTGEYEIELWGASGGVSDAKQYSKGGYTKGIVHLAANQKIYIFTGEEGINNSTTPTFNGGGKGGIGSVSGTSGGGSTDIRLYISEDESWDNFDSLKSRIMVAGGGGGSSNQSYSTGGEGSYAGGLIGFSGGYYSGHGDKGQYGKGGTQISGGEKGNNHFDATGIAYPGSFGIGGDNDTVSSSSGAGGGGGGYYGGGAGGGTKSEGSGQGGGGGSSFISGYEGCNAIDESSTEDNIIHTGQSIHYSGLKFTDSIMKSGNEEMPTYDGTNTMTGNSGNGYAKITKIASGEVQTVEKPKKPTNGYTTDDYVKDGLKLHLDGLTSKNTLNIWEDVSENKNNGIKNGNTNLSDDYGLVFNGINNYVDVGKQNYDNITLEVTVKYNNRSNQKAIANTENGGNAIGIINGKNHVYSYIGGNYVELTGSNVDITKKYNLTYTYDGHIAKLYENGVLVDSREVEGIIGYNSTVNTFIGADPSASGNHGSWFNGEIYSARIYDRALTKEEIQNNYEMDDIRYNGFSAKQVKEKESIDLNISDFTYNVDITSYSGMTQGNNSINTTTSNSTNQSVTYYNNKIKVDNQISIKGTIDLYQNWQDKQSLGTVYIGLSKTNENRIDDFIEYEKFDVTSTTPTSKDFMVTTYEPGEYYLKMVTYHNNNTSEYTVYSNINKLEIVYRPELKVAVRKEAILTEVEQKGSITATTGGLIYNDENSHLSIKQGILNLNKSGTSSQYLNGILNYGTIELDKDSILNDSAINNNLIYNKRTGKIISKGTTINITNSGLARAIYNESNVQDRLENITMNLSKGSNIGILNSSNGNFTISNVRINNAGTGIYNYKNSGILSLEDNNVTSVTNALLIEETTGETNINSGTYQSNNASLTAGGQINKNININNGNFKSDMAAIVINRNSTITMNNGNVNAINTGIHISGGTFNMKNGNINSNMLGINCSYHYNYSYKGSLTIEGGTITSLNGIINNASIAVIDNLNIESTHIGIESSVEGAITNITNTSINADYRGISNAGSTTNINGGVVINNSNRGITNSDSGIVNINGEIQLNSKEYGIYTTNSSTTNIGTKDGIINEYPKISSDGYGVYSVNATTNYYDGEISTKLDESKYKGIHGYVSDKEDNYDINVTIENNRELTNLRTIKYDNPTISDYVAELNNVKYLSLQEAIDAAPDNEISKVTLLKNIKTIQSNVVGELKNIIIDFNGFSSDYYSSDSLIRNNGILTLTDSTKVESNGIITLGATLLTSTGGNIVSNTGTLTIDGVSMLNPMTSNPVIENSGNLIVKSGTITGNSIGINNIDSGSVTINNGTITMSTSESYKTIYAIYNKTGTINYKNGTISIRRPDSGHAYGIYNESGIVNYENGTITSTYGGVTGLYNENGTLNIDNGIMNANVNIVNNSISKIDNVTLKNNPSYYYVSTIENRGTMEINDITTSNGCNIYNRDEGNLTIDGGEINSQVINYNIGVITITGGSISVEDGNAVENRAAGTIVLGTKDGEVSKETPVIISNNSYGLVNSTTGIFNFYDGIIKGKTDAISGTINNIEEGYDVIEEQEVDLKIKYLDKLPVAKIKSTGKPYEDLQEAINQASTGDEIEILRNITYTEDSNAIVISEDKNITIDIKGYEVRSGNNLLFENSGTLTITDSGREENGNMVYGLVLSTGGSIISNTGTLTIDMNSSSQLQTIVNSDVITNSGNLIVKSGTITGNSIGINNIDSGSVTINNGTITMSTSESYKTIYAIYNKTGTINYKNGTISLSKPDSGYAYGIYNESGIVNYENGTITSTYGGVTGLYNENGTLNIDNGIMNASVNIVNKATSTINNVTLKNNPSYYFVSTIENSGTMEINDITTSNGCNIYNRDEGNLTINGGEINSQVINYNTGIITITGGSISTNEGNAVENSNAGTIVLGTKDGEVSKETPVIISNNSYGLVNSATGIFNFYDGIIKGKIDATNGKITEIESEYNIIETQDGDLKVKYLDKLSVARIKSTGESYNNLQEAINQATNGDTIEILRNIQYTQNSDTIVISEDKNITIDINGYKVESGNEILFENSGTLTITDSGREENESMIYGLLRSINGSIISNTATLTIDMNSSSQMQSTADSNVIANSGSLTINSGTIKTGALGIHNAESGIVRMINGTISSISDDKYSNAIHNYGELIIEDGIINTYTGIYNYKKLTIENVNMQVGRGIGVYNDVNAEAILKDGTYTVRSSSAYGIDNKGTLTIEKGTYTSNNSVVANLGTLVINDGIFNPGRYSIENQHNLTINGGTFNKGGWGNTINSTDQLNISGGIYKGTIDNGGSANISNAIIEDCSKGIINSSGITNILDNVIIRNVTSAINNKQGTINISTGVTINATDIAVYNESNGTINIGAKDGDVSVENPSITGINYGIFNNGTGPINIYDGIIAGSENKAIYGLIGDIEPGYRIKNITNGNVTSATLDVMGSDTRVIYVDGKGNFSNLQSAINSSIDGVETNMTLYSNIDLDSDVVVSENKNIKIYLNGNTINYNGYSITGTGKIQIIDTNNKATTILGNIVNVIKDVLDISDISKDIIVYEMDDGSILKSNKTYKLFKDGKFIKINEQESLGRYSIGNMSDIMTTVRGRLYINNLSSGNYEVIDNDGLKASFTITDDNKLYGSAAENIVKENRVVIASAVAELIISMQTGVIKGRYFLVLGMISIILVLLIVIKRRKSID